MPYHDLDRAATGDTLDQLQRHAVTLGGILDIVLGCLGGVVGTYFSIRHTHHPREQRFMIPCAILVWILFRLAILTVCYSPTLQGWAWVPLRVLFHEGVPARRCLAATAGTACATQASLGKEPG